MVGFAVGEAVCFFVGPAVTGEEVWPPGLGEEDGAMERVRHKFELTKVMRSPTLQEEETATYLEAGAVVMGYFGLFFLMTTHSFFPFRVTQLLFPNTDVPLK